MEKLYEALVSLIDSFKLGCVAYVVYAVLMAATRH